MTDISTKLGQVLRKSREGRGLSQEALAELADVNRGFLGEIERGARSASIETIKKLADALNEPISELLRKAEEHA